MKNIRCIRISGHFRVKGIVNTHGQATLKGYENYVAAKKDRTGRDFTSSQCLERALYEYNQPTPEALREVLPRFAASIPGVLRGFLEPKNANKRMKSFRLLDAYTFIEDLVSSSGTNAQGDWENSTAVFKENCTSSKDIEGKTTDEAGKEKSDTKFFVVDNAPERRQELDCELNFADLQFIRLSGDGSVVDSNRKTDFLKELSKTLSRLGASPELNTGNFSHAHDPFAKKIEGVLLSDAQMAAFANWYLGRLRRLFISKRRGWLRTDPASLKANIVFAGDFDDKAMPFEELRAKISEFEFAKDWNKEI